MAIAKDIFWGDDEKAAFKVALHSLFSYNPETGILTRKIKVKWVKKNQNVGDAVGGIHPQKYGVEYLRIRVLGSFYTVHRLAYIMSHTEWPNQIDHIDGDGLNNRILNLRSVNTQGNARNRKRISTNTTGVTGVYKAKDGKFYSQIKINGKSTHIGVFNNIHDAEIARKSADVKNGFHANHGRA